MAPLKYGDRNDGGRTVQHDEQPAPARRRHPHLPRSRAQWRGRLGQLGTELLLILVAAIVYAVVRQVTEGSPERGLMHARELVRVERHLGIAHEHDVQSVVLDRPYLRTFANWVYIWGHWPVIAMASIGIYLARHANYVRMRNAIFASGMIGFVFFALLPMSPPRLTPFGYVDTVTTWSGSYRALQPPRYTNLHAAMPSLHFGWDLLVGATLFLSARNWAIRLLGLAMPAVMAFAVVATGNHWILDVIVGLLVVALGVAVSEGCRGVLMHRRRRTARSPTKASVGGTAPAPSKRSA
ncbi:MAG: phosphoesterase, PA-phosphatase related protein [Thermoleophilia bacterium]|nr:phosphoesterase, PA-phosphatase related protein [Thermoleophilia bacterium]